MLSFVLTIRFSRRDRCSAWFHGCRSFSGASVPGRGTPNLGVHVPRSQTPQSLRFGGRVNRTPHGFYAGVMNAACASKRKQRGISWDILVCLFFDAVPYECAVAIPAWTFILSGQPDAVQTALLLLPSFLALLHAGFDALRGAAIGLSPF